MHRNSPPFILAVDTSTELMTLAVSGPRGIHAQQAPGGAEASKYLLDRLQAMMQAQDLVWSDLQAIAFGRGPGAFTGLRTACAVAQGLAFGAGLPVLPVDSLLAVAETYRRRQAAQQQDWPSGAEVGVVMDARMGQVYAARYRWGSGQWVCTQTERVGEPALQALGWDGWPDAVVGSGVSLIRPPPTTGCQEMGMDAMGLMAAAQQAWSANLACAADQALPVYVRDKVAQTSAERAAAGSVHPTRA